MPAPTKPPRHKKTNKKSKVRAAKKATTSRGSKPPRARAAKEDTSWDTDEKPVRKKLARDKPHEKSKGRGRKNTKKPDFKKAIYNQRGSIAHISTLVITGTTDDGELLAAPTSWEGRHEPPRIIVVDAGSPAPAIDDRVLCRTEKILKHLYHAQVINILPKEKTQSISGVFVATADGGIIEPLSRRIKESYLVAAGDTHGAVQGELVIAETLPSNTSLRMTYAKVTERIGDSHAPRAASLIASQLHDLPNTFSQATLAETDCAQEPTLQEGRTDLRDIPLVTIDGEDARDFDDAVFAERDGKGWHILVAIADVAHYVKPDSALDATAFERGNSVYFPDRVIPMLPERLSNGLCSLRPDGPRYCLAVHMWLDDKGTMTRYKFVRGLMQSRARLTYTQVQQAYDEKKHELYDEVIAPLYGAYEVLAKERDNRGSLDLNLPEFQIHFDDDGHVSAIAPRERLESHRLIEAFMIAANVAAADFLLEKKLPGMYRVHEDPSDEKIEDLKNMLKAAGYNLQTGAAMKAKNFNYILEKVKGKPEEYLVNTAILRSQMQAYYDPECLGHFGLSLRKYAHFTSPIRRYADLVVHRSLAAAIDNRKLEDSPRKLADVAQHISDTERRAMLAERDASDRYKIAFMSDHIGSVFPGTITSVNEYGLFVALDSNGVTGFIPIRALSGDFFQYDKKLSALKGVRTRQMFQLGQPLIIRVEAANAITGSLIFELAKPEGMPQKPTRPSKPHDAKRKRSKQKQFDRRSKYKKK